MTVRVDGMAKKEKWKWKRLSHHVLVVSSLLGLGYFCYAYRKHYIVSRVMKSIHLFPSVLPDSVQSLF